jgi:hypothetical protein
MKISRLKLTALAAVALAGALISIKYQTWIVIPKARQSIMVFLKDPESAQFRNEHITKSGALCGEVNAKNSMGGYVGFKRYIAVDNKSNYVEGSEPLNGWSTADLERRKAEEGHIFARFIDFRKESPDFPVPSESERARMARDGFFDLKWADLCATAEHSKG